MSNFSEAVNNRNSEPVYLVLEFKDRTETVNVSDANKSNSAAHKMAVGYMHDIEHAIAAGQQHFHLIIKDFRLLFMLSELRFVKIQFGDKHPDPNQIDRQ